MLDWRACLVCVEYSHGAVVHSETISAAIRWRVCRTALVVFSVFGPGYVRLTPGPAKMGSCGVLDGLVLWLPI